MSHVKIKIAPSSGFCDGVLRIIRMIETALDQGPYPVYSLGDPIHNPGVVSKFKSRGLIVHEAVNEIPSGCSFVIRAHGIAPGICEMLLSRGTHIIDGTCPHVKLVHRYILQALDADNRIIIVGNMEHPEIQCHLAYSNYQASIVSSMEDLPELNITAMPTTLLAQTTSDPLIFRNIELYLKNKLHDLLTVKYTICHHTIAAREGAAATARDVDAMIVIGGKHSSNTMRLVDTCLSVCSNVIHIENPADIDINLIFSTRSIGITAGASTPPEDINILRNILVNTFS